MKTDKLQEFGKMILNVCSATLGASIIGLEPEENPVDGVFWCEHTEEELKQSIAPIRDRYEGAVEYTPTENEIVELAKIMYGDDYEGELEWLHTCSYKKKDNIVFVSTSRRSWNCLCGREWRIDIETRTSKLIRMS